MCVGQVCWVHTHQLGLQQKPQQLEERTRVLVEKEGRFEFQFNCAIWFLLCFSKNFLVVFQML
jgi:hypothetical protein